jgi:hypothetical protein
MKPERCENTAHIILIEPRSFQNEPRAVECWSIGVLGKHFSALSSHHSIPPLLHRH